MSAADQGLDAAVQRVISELGCSNRRGVCTLHGLALWLDLGCEGAVQVARAAREDVPALTQQARAEALEEAAKTLGHAVDCHQDPDRDPYIGCACRVSLLYARAAAIREGREP